MGITSGTENTSYINSLLQQANTQALAAKKPSGKPHAGKDDIERTAKDFEAVFISETMRLLFKDVKADPVFGTTASDEIYRDMLLDQFSKKISDTGGFGIAHHIESELLKLQEA